MVQVKKKVLRRLREQAWSAAWVEAQQEAFYEQIEAGAFKEGGAEGELPPRPIPLTGEDVENKVSADLWLEQVDEWWRLDVLVALEDALDDE
ncbi:hypothetical protein GTR02_21100 [Kineococcus sp. R8]|nr:hypothetical protein [Kineococcus siccus]